MKPMLAGKLEDPHQISYPVLVSPKLDGVRCLIVNGQAMSRNLKPIPNRAVQDILAGMPSFDGELVVGEPNAPDCFNRTSSGVMSRDGMPKFIFWVFDLLTNDAYPFAQRLEMAKNFVNGCGKNVQHVTHKLIKSPDALLDYEAKMLLHGYEGIMIRDPAGPYKQGRSTAREGYLLKLKRFEDGEAKIIGFVEKEHNNNEQTRDALGRAKRSSHKSGKVGADTLGTLCVQDVATGVEFEIGSGFSDAERDAIWSRRRARSSDMGRIVKYRYQAVGVKEKPRFPVFIGFRDERDL